MSDSTVVEAVGASAGRKRDGLARRIEEAMAQAVLDATIRDGIPMSDSDEIRRRMLEARERVVAESRE